MDVKALFPIGKTQWRKWVPEQKIAFNEARASGVPFADAVDYVNRLELVEVNIAPPPKKSGLLRALEDTIDGLNSVGEVVGAVTHVVEVATPMVAVAKTVKRAAKKKAK